GKPLDPDQFRLNKPPANTPVKTIKCEFANRTAEAVTFRLNGGAGASATLGPGKSVTCTVVGDLGVPPAGFIRQKNGSESSFALSDGDHYMFIVQGGKIVNAYSK